jgi:hypothetical protein
MKMAIMIVEALGARKYITTRRVKMYWPLVLVGLRGQRRLLRRTFRTHSAAELYAGNVAERYNRIFR